MFNSSYRVKVPGKLFIAGEYAVLEPNQQAIVIAVDRYITAVIEPSEQNILSLPEIGFDQVSWVTSGHTIKFSESDPKLRFVQNAISTVNQLLQEKYITQRSFRLTISSELDDSSGRKYGLGSSAAIVVAVISSILHWYRQDLKPTSDLIFKLSAIAHLQTQGNGSGADVAASTYGGWLCYSAFQPSWIHAQLEKGSEIGQLLNEPWPYVNIAKITPPENLRLCVGWTREEAATGPMVKNTQTLRGVKPELYEQFLEKSSNAVAKLVENFSLGDVSGAISSLEQNRNALVKLGEDAGVSIETGDLNLLAQIARKYGSGKSSGAGGGDCGIAFINGDDHIEELMNAWQEAGIVPLDLKVSPHGVFIEAID